MSTPLPPSPGHHPPAHIHSTQAGDLLPCQRQQPHESPGLQLRGMAWRGMAKRWLEDRHAHAHAHALALVAAVIRHREPPSHSYHNLLLSNLSIDPRRDHPPAASSPTTQLPPTTPLGYSENHYSFLLQLQPDIQASHPATTYYILPYPLPRPDTKIIALYAVRDGPFYIILRGRLTDSSSRTGRRSLPRLHLNRSATDTNGACTARSCINVPACSRLPDCLVAGPVTKRGTSKQPDSQTDMMISREVQSFNMGRGAYDTTDLPKPPPPKPR
ncbi:hypothetical protein HYFRA_00000407 [Hymenoscyphus fraxineus]|uniref:Uncharacterized protein n=1 Tax=Hymenoscyphus fraxineus TaxID=746836 RepID=A0A9N9L4P5_9HELO|nr:hypothetical protein HYFRA_00000407 [Hymenoscyphus fraxineus]